MTQIVADATSLAALCERIVAAPRIAFDTEFHNERSYSARLMVVQIGFDDGVVIVDPLAIDDLTPLARAMRETLVVGHALSSDLRIFAERFDVLPKAVFDTQIGAAFCGFGVSISLLDLVQAITGVRLRKSQTVSDWSARPLSERQLEYLVDDVAYLFALHDELSARLERSGRAEWAREEAAELVDPEEYRRDPERLYLRIPGAMRLNRRELAILREVAEARDALARERDVPAKFIFPDDAAIGIVQLRPAKFEELQQLRRLDGGMRKLAGARIVDAVARALALPDDELPVKPPRHPTQNREAIVSLLAVIAGAVAAEHDLPQSLLVPRSALERVARELPADLDTMAAALEISPWRIELLAAPLLDVLHGRTVVAVEGADRGSPRVATRSLAQE